MDGRKAAYFQNYYAAGGPTTVDVVSIHGYPSVCYDVPETLWPTDTGASGCGGAELYGPLQSVIQNNGLSSKPLWDTEGSWYSSTYLPDADQQAAFVARFLVLHRSLNFERFYWYAFDSSSYGKLWSGSSGLTTAGTAYKTVRDWLNGATGIVGSVSKNGSVYSGSFMLSSGLPALVAWDAGTTGYDGSSVFTTPSQYTQYEDLTGVIHSIINNQVTLGMKPILLISGGTTPSCNISASPSTIAVGNPTTLTWVSTNAVSASLSSIGAVQTTSSQTLTPPSTTTYTLTVTAARRRRRPRRPCRACAAGMRGPAQRRPSDRRAAPPRGGIARRSRRASVRPARACCRASSEGREGMASVKRAVSRANPR